MPPVRAIAAPADRARTVHRRALPCTISRQCVASVRCHYTRAVDVVVADCRFIASQRVNREPCQVGPSSGHAKHARTVAAASATTLAPGDNGYTARSKPAVRVGNVCANGPGFARLHMRSNTSHHSLARRLLVVFIVGCNNDIPQPGASAGAAASMSGIRATTSADNVAGVTAPLAPIATAMGGANVAAVTSSSGGMLGRAGADANVPSAGASGLAQASMPAAGLAGTRSSMAVAGASGNAGPPKGPNSDPKYMNLAPTMGPPLDGVGKPLTPPAPLGWIWYEIDGAVCRDGSPTGFFVHAGTADKLLIYLEGGGACSSSAYCNFNPPSASTSLSGDGQTVIGSALGVIDSRQQPGVYSTADHTAAPAGIFDFSNTANPFKDWSQIYIPYCTGDVFFGTKTNGSVPGLMNQQFVGHLDMKLFMSRIVPTFKDKVSRVVLAGASAGAFGATLNFSMVQDSFGSVPVDLINDSGPSFEDEYTPTCMQQRWRDAWGFDGALPPDCAECRQAGGGGLLRLSDFMLQKHPNMRVALLSSMEDQVIRLFYSVGLNDCAQYDTLDPVIVTLDQSLLFPADTYSAGLNALRSHFVPSGRYATFFMSGLDPTLHQHIFRSELFEPFGNMTQAQFLTQFLAGKILQAGP